VTTVPAAAQYAYALKMLNVSKRIGDVRWRWLRAHYQAPEHTLSTMELARIAGYETHGGVNLHYGRFGFDLSKKLRWAVPPGEPFACRFATFSDPDPEHPDTLWHLRPEVVDALDELRWFPRRV
jgi:hypothetical protein